LPKSPTQQRSFKNIAMILVAGSANLDFVVRAGHIPAPGETVLGREFKTFPGGKGVNQAVACARAGGVPTAMLLALGNDAFATPLIDSLTQAGVQLHTVRAATQPTGTAFICVSDDGENAITVAPGANNALLPAHWAQYLPSLQGITHLLMQLETPIDTVQAYAQAAKAQGVQVVLNAAPARALPAPLLALVDILIVNEGELTALTESQGNGQGNAQAIGRSSTPSKPPRALQDKLAQLPVPCVVVTLGAQGCLARVRDAQARSTLIEQTAFKVQVVDTTAAGDTFCGALVAALSQQAPLALALQRASAAASLACTQLGAQSSIPSASAVAQLLQQPIMT
jgi:ribokinase